MTIELQLRHELPTFVDVFDVDCSQLVTCSVAEIQRRELLIGNRPASLGEIFQVSKTGGSDTVRWCGDLRKVHGIGHRFGGGHLRIEGNAGNHVGGRMIGGSITVDGDVGHWAGAEMQGGSIQIRGHAGNGAGGAYQGSQLGQQGGMIQIEGSAGEDLGRSMRRGVIAVANNVADRCAYHLRAGTIVVGGAAGDHLGTEMVRGTVVLLQGGQDSFPGFRLAGRRRPLVTRLIGTYLSQFGLFDASSFQKTFNQYHGDILSGARGELFVANEG